MKTSDIVQMKRDITIALDAAGRKEMGWYVFVEKMDELGYDIVQRPPMQQPERITQVGWIEPSLEPTNAAEDQLSRLAVDGAIRNLIGH